MISRSIACSVAFGFCFLTNFSSADEFYLHQFDRQQLTDTYFSEGANVGDLNRDGKLDAIHGPYWWEGPEFKVRREIYPPKPQNRDGYANNFFTWVYDFTGDGWNDLVSVGLPGSAAVMYVNPGEGKVLDVTNHWQTHKVFDGVGNESPQFINLVGDAQPELVFNHNGKFGFATFDVRKPTEPWMWHAISDQVGEYPFGHGLGVGDVNGDGRQDVIWKGGWYEQPKSLEDDPRWTFQKYQFAGPGGADMFAYDVDGDGDNDVITSLAAHTFGLAWFEQIGSPNPKPASGGRQPPGSSNPNVDPKATGGLTPSASQNSSNQITFKKHVILGEKSEDNRYGVLFTEPHAVALHDMDGDGLKDIVTGKTYWSHHRQSPMWDAGAVVYWFKLTRTENIGRGDEGERGRGGEKSDVSTVDWIPYLADEESGIGRQLAVGDVNGDKLPDIVVGGMKGAHVLLHRREKVTQEEWFKAQPKPRVAMADGLSPEDAAKQMTVPPGFKVQLAAGEPLVHQPIAFTFDSRGRIWVAEAYTYPNRAPEGKGQDKIVILEDQDGDGYFETRKVFIEGLNLVSGLELGFGGVWVGAAPYLMFIPDRDGDDVPDVAESSRLTPAPTGRASNEKPRRSATNAHADGVGVKQDVPPGATVLLDGFGWHDTHETLNAFIWGPDGWLYGCHGVFTHSRVGKPGTPDDQRTPMNAAVWRYHPTKHIFEIFAHGASNQWGVDFNEYGHAFITACVIPHLYHVIQGGRYQRQAGQHFDKYTFDDIKTIADHAHYVGRIQDHAWWGHEPHAPTDTLAAGGGHAHAGALIYLGDNFPPQYRNTIFMSNIHGNRVNQDILERRGSGYVGKHGKDLLIANDRWFRGINLKTGPDGSVYVIDWYDKNACHRANPEIWDRTNGRIYNVKYAKEKPHLVFDGGRLDPFRLQSSKDDLAQLSDSELVRLRFHPNNWYARMGRRILQERTSAGTLTDLDLRDLCDDAIDDVVAAKRLVPLYLPHRLGALWTLHALAQSQRGNDRDSQSRQDLTRRVEEVLHQELLQNKDDNLRAWAIQLELEDRVASPEVVERLAELAQHDPSPLVRLHLASGLQRLPSEQRWLIAAGLVTHADDADDHNLPLMYWYGIEPLVAADPDRALVLANKSKIPKVANFIIRRAASDERSLDAVLKMLTKAHQEGQQIVLNEVLAAFEGRVNIAAPESWKSTYEVLAKSDNPVIRDKADQIAVIFGDQRVLPRMRELLVNDKAPVEKRQQALDILLRGRDKDAVGAFQAIVSDVDLRGAAIRALSGYDDVKTPSVVLAQYGKLTEAEKRDAISTLCTRPTYAAALLDAIEKEQLPRTDLHAYNVQALLRFNDEKLHARIKSVWGEFRATAKDKQELIAKLKANLTPARLKNGDLSNGRRLFSKTCQSCHTLFGEGQKVGPDITGSNRANLDYILENLLDPSAIVGKDYRATVIATTDGRVVSGLVQKETDSAVTLRTINDTIVIANSDIDERKLSELSIMPERQLETFSADEVRDLIAYLASPIQVALRGPRAPIDRKTRRVPDALEGELLKIVGKTQGNAVSQTMDGFPKDRWSGDDQLWWTGAAPGARLDLEVPVEKDGRYEIEIVLTKARDYGIVQLSLDDEPLGEPIDGFNEPDVSTTGVLSLGERSLKSGSHKLSFKITGAHPKAVRAFMVGVDYVRLVPKGK